MIQDIPFDYLANGTTWLDLIKYAILMGMPVLYHLVNLRYGNPKPPAQAKPKCSGECENQ